MGYERQPLLQSLINIIPLNNNIMTQQTTFEAKFQNGQQVKVTIEKNGYWQAAYKGMVIDEKKGMVKVHTRQNGNRWYKTLNVRPA